MTFVLTHDTQASPAPDALCIVSRVDKVLVAEGPAGPGFPEFSALTRNVLDQASPLFLGSLYGRPCWALSPSEEIPVPAPLQWTEARPLAARLPDAPIQALAAARELLWWSARHRFCGCCGTPLVDSPTERARTCPSCKAVHYPVIAPAVIVAITRGDELLLAHNRNFRPNLFSLIAGFVDPGETLEQCVVREAREETGIELARPRYIISQPWPHPNSLMLGFTAEWKAGELRPDGVEIEQAAWFRRDRLPEIPWKGTVARQLIDLWLDGRL